MSLEFKIFDNPKRKGVDLVISTIEDEEFTFFIEDSIAQEMVNIIQNKLDGRFK